MCNYTPCKVTCRHIPVGCVRQTKASIDRLSSGGEIMMGQTHVPCWQAGWPCSGRSSSSAERTSLWICAIKFICCLMHDKTRLYLLPGVLFHTFFMLRCMCVHVHPCMRYRQYARVAKVWFTGWFDALVSLLMWALSSELLCADHQQSMAGM